MKLERRLARFLQAGLLLCFVACSKAEVPAPVISATASVTSPPTETPSPSATLTPTLTATPVLFPGTLTTRVNVRSGPGTAYASLGLLDAGESVQIIARTNDSQWYQILYPSAAQGYGWVAAQFVVLPAGVQIPPEAVSGGVGGRVTQRLNVRSGPAVTFDILGTLESGTTVVLRGKNSTASWFQIDYPPGPGGIGWVAAQYVQTDAVAELPVLDEYGRIVQETASTPMTPTPTVGPALADGDSHSNPAVHVVFSAGGTRQLTYSSQVSAPEGDGEDWVEFIPYSSRVTFSLSCTGNGALRTELWVEGKPLDSWESLRCGDTAKSVSLSPGLPYQLRLAVIWGETLQLVQYWLTIHN